VALYLGARPGPLDPILDACVAVYKEHSTRTGRWTSRARPRPSLRTYGFLASILPYTNAEWEKLSIFLNFLVPKLPAPEEEDLSKGILEAIDMDSYRVEKQAADDPASRRRRRDRAGAHQRAAAASPSPSSTGCPTSSRRSTTSSATSRGATPTACTSSSPRTSRARGRRHGLPERQKNSDKQNARIEHDKALARDDRRAEGRHRALQAVHGQRVVQALDDGHRAD
jgi:type I restriction enzyme, R subunit